MFCSIIFKITFCTKWNFVELFSNCSRYLQQMGRRFVKSAKVMKKMLKVDKLD